MSATLHTSREQCETLSKELVTKTNEAETLALSVHEKEKLAQALHDKQQECDRLQQELRVQENLKEEMWSESNAIVSSQRTQLATLTDERTTLEEHIAEGNRGRFNLQTTLHGARDAAAALQERVNNLAQQLDDKDTSLARSESAVDDMTRKYKQLEKEKKKMMQHSRHLEQVVHIATSNTVAYLKDIIVHVTVRIPCV